MQRPSLFLLWLYMCSEQGVWTNEMVQAEAPAVVACSGLASALATSGVVASAESGAAAAGVGSEVVAAAAAAVPEAFSSSAVSSRMRQLDSLVGLVAVIRSVTASGWPGVLIADGLRGP